MRRHLTLAMAIGLVTAALLILPAAPALAHEERAVGPFDLAVGFGQEPAFAGQPNSAQMLLSRGGTPVVDLGDRLKVSVGFGDRSVELSIEPFFEVGEFGTPGDYRAWFIPTRAGRYAFHFSGTIDGTPIDETFTSGPKTFDDVRTPSEAEFPVQDPTNGELAERIDREVPRLEAAISDSSRVAARASDDAGTARALGIAGIVVGALGLGVASVTFVSTRRRRA